MGKIIARDFISVDILDLTNYKPNSLEDIYFELEFTVEDVASESGSNFSIMIVTVESLKKHNVQIKRNAKVKYKVIWNYDWQEIVQWIEKIVFACDTDDYNDSAEKLRQYFNWEYE